MAAATARAPNSHQSQEGAPLVWASAPAAGCSVVVDGDGTVDEAGAGDVGCGEAVAVTVAVDGLLVGVGPELGFNVGLGAEVVELGEDTLEDALEGGLPRVGVVGLFSVRVGAGCSIVVVGDAVMVRDRDTVGAVMEPSPLHEATSTAARPMTAACETSVSAALGTCRCVVVIVALLVVVLVGTFKTVRSPPQRRDRHPCAAWSQEWHRTHGHCLVLSGGVLRASRSLKKPVPALAVVRAVPCMPSMAARRTARHGLPGGNHSDPPEGLP
jgi:hypothetical protein